MGNNCAGLVQGNVAPMVRASRAHNRGSNPDNNRRVQLFEPALREDDLDISALVLERSIDAEVKQLIMQCLSNFFGDENAKTKMKLVIGAMEREVLKPNKVIIRQGDPGDKLYIIERGTLEVDIDGLVVRTMAKGDMVGELALLYDAPRGATVRTLEDTVAWSLTREHFKKLQAVTSSAVSLQRAKWLIASTDLATLSQINLSRILGVLQVRKYASGEELFKDGAATDEIVLIESGRARVSTSQSVVGLDQASKDELLGIVRPKVRARSLISMDASQLAATMTKGASAEEVDIEVEDDSYEVYDGCIVGLNGLRAKAGLSNAGAWRWSKSAEFAVSPLTVVADGSVDALVFTGRVFETLFGVDSIGAGHRTTSVDRSGRSLRKYDGSNFKMKHVLGSGSFGVVIYAESKEDRGFYALKFLSKVDIMVTGQLKHVQDERKLLAMMDSPFILKLYGTYQTPHQIVLVTEAMNNGDMWAVIYEVFYHKGGLPVRLVQFYAASIVLALSHIHSKGLAYRDLKPENIMIDSKGYPKIIDFGFCKMIPYTKADEATGESKVYAKSYTLCGTPEYLAPEFVFNLGHDHSADLWALGVMVYEFFMTATPFVPRKADNLTDLFNNIANTKTNGMKIPPKLDERAKSKSAGELVLKLLKPQPSERMGVQEGYTSVILEHAFFAGFEVDQLRDGTAKPVFVPKPPSEYLPMSSLNPIKAYKSDNSVFELF